VPLSPARVPPEARSPPDAAPARPAELAAMYKNEGNAYFGEKDYGRAVRAYSEGLRQRFGDAELRAALLSNRAAAQCRLGEPPPPPQDGQAVQFSRFAVCGTRL